MFFYDSATCKIDATKVKGDVCGHCLTHSDGHGPMPTPRSGPDVTDALHNLRLAHKE